MGRKKHKNTKSPSTKSRATSSYSSGGESLAALDVTNVKSPNMSVPKSLMLFVLVLLLAMTLFIYWPTFQWMESQWRTQPDYSHGYLVAPLALMLLHRRRDIFPGLCDRVNWMGFALLLLAIGARIIGRIAYMDFLDGWTLVLWIGGVVWVLFGLRVFLWALPAIAFLLLLVPLPYKAETLLSWRLQGISTNASVMVLQTLGLPAVAEGHTIWLEDKQMLVEEACSGLRIFVGMGAMGYVIATLARRAWIDKFVILACALPIAVLANVLRVVGTVISYHYLDPDTAHWAHDQLGLAMIIVGAGLLFAVKVYWERLYRPLDTSLNMGKLALDV